MEDFDKVFSKKLYNHKTTPPSDIWDAMDKALDQEERNKKKIFFWRIAAAVSFFLVAGSLFLINNDAETPAQLTDIEQVYPEPMEELTPKHNNVLSLDEETKNTHGENLENMSQVANNESDKPEKTVYQVDLKVSENSDKLALVQKEEQGQVFIKEPVLERVKPIRPALADMEPRQPIALTENPATVTIIYRPGERQDRADMGKPLELLADLKNSGISIAEIRSAKSELLAKVFNKLDNELER